MTRSAEIRRAGILGSGAPVLEPVIDIFPVEAETLSAAAFLKLVKEHPSIIKSSTIVKPQPGKPGFGGFQVIYSRPIYKSVFPTSTSATAKFKK